MVPSKTKPEFEFHQLAESDTDGVTFRKSTGDIVAWSVYSEIMDEWFNVPLDLIQQIFPNKLINAQIEVDKMKAAYCDVDHLIDQDCDDKLSEGA